MNRVFLLFPIGDCDDYYTSAKKMIGIMVEISIGRNVAVVGGFDADEKTMKV